MNDVILLHLLAATLYAMLCVVQAGALYRAGGAGAPIGLGKRLVLAGALLVHGAALHAGIFGAGQMMFGVGLAASLMLWLAVAFYWIEAFYARLDGRYLPALLAGLLGSALPLLFDGRFAVPNAHSALFRAHFIVAMLAYSLFALAALHAVLMMAVEQQLHKGRLSLWIGRLPPLLTMEALLFRLIGVAFVLLTLTVISGSVFSMQVLGQVLRFEHKPVFTLLSWVFFGILLFGRWRYGWRGRRALRWTLAGFAALLLAYLGSRFVLEVLLHRTS